MSAAVEAHAGCAAAADGGLFGDRLPDATCGGAERIVVAALDRHERDRPLLASVRERIALQRPWAAASVAEAKLTDVEVQHDLLSREHRSVETLLRFVAPRARAAMALKIQLVNGIVQRLDVERNGTLAKHPVAVLVEKRRPSAHPSCSRCPAGARIPLRPEKAIRVCKGLYHCQKTRNPHYASFCLHTNIIS